MPFGPALAILVFLLLCWNKNLADAEKKRIAKEKKQKEAARKAKLAEDVLRLIMK